MKHVTATVRRTHHDSILESAKRQRQAREYEAVRNGKRTAQSLHLFGRDIVRNIIVQYKDVDFD